MPARQLRLGSPSVSAVTCTSTRAIEPLRKTSRAFASDQWTNPPGGFLRPVYVPSSSHHSPVVVTRNGPSTKYLRDQRLAFLHRATRHIPAMPDAVSRPNQTHQLTPEARWSNQAPTEAIAGIATYQRTFATNEDRTPCQNVFRGESLPNAHHSLVCSPLSLRRTSSPASASGAGHRGRNT